MTVRERVALVGGVASATAPDGAVFLLRAAHRQALGRLTDAERERLTELAAGPCAPDGELVDRLRHGGWLTTQVSDVDGRRYDLVPVRPPVAHEPVDGAVRLSRFAALRPVDGRLVLSSPLAWCDVLVHDPQIAAALAALARPLVAAELAGLPAATAARLLADLTVAGLVVGAGAEQDLAHRQWSPHELCFHEHTRIGLRDGPIGATFWADGEFPPPPAHRPPWPGPATALPVPADSLLDRPFAEVLAARESVREHDDDAPLDVAALAAFLHRVAAVRAVLPGAGGEQVDRAVPAAGAAHELELYLAVHTVTGLEAGLYHYDAHEHVLRRVAPDGGAVRRLLADARAGAELAGPPQVLIVLAARFSRLMWKYQELSYALVLKDVGVLQQQLYLVATAMRLAPCALGTGDSLAFRAATGLDPLQECSVGEFVLGTRRPQ